MTKISPHPQDPAYARIATPAPRAATPSQSAQTARTDGVDAEHDGDGDDRASVTPTRGQNVNTVA